MQTSANGKVRIALIGAGGMGVGDTGYALQIPGVELAAVSDLYDSRLEGAQERWGKQIFTTRDYREVLARPDVDAVIVATPDHWHATITKDAFAAGKDVYCEKPMVQRIEEGKGVIEAAAKTKRVLQVGSQYASSVVFQKAQELFKAGAIGELNMVEAVLDRNTALGAWQYSIPPDASPQNIDWDRFLGRAPKRPFDATRFFRWRNYQDYGTGAAGDLFVHLLTGLHVVTNSLGPTRIYSSGGTRAWKDGRDVADVLLAMMDYPKTEAHPAFTLALRVNLAAGAVTENFSFRFVGSEGVMTAGMTTLTLAKTPRETEPGYSIDTFPQAIQQQFLEGYRKQFPLKAVDPSSIGAESELRFSVPRGYSAHLEHHRNFYNAVRSRKPFFEDATFGLRTAGPSLLTNTSMYEKRVCHWDPASMTAS
jgi:predicted dehydrogenase